MNTEDKNNYEINHDRDEKTIFCHYGEGEQHRRKC
jgi:hypothetical protein